MDILVNKTIQTMDAFNIEFAYLQPDNNHTIFYVKRPDDTIFPFRGYAFSNDGVMRVKTMVADGKFGWVLVRQDDQVYFTNQVINMKDFQTAVQQLSSNYTVTQGTSANNLIIFN